MKKNILLCDANFCVLPILEAIKKREYDVSVVGRNMNDPAHAIADHSVNLDYADVALLRQHISRNQYEGIVPGCNDRSYISLAYVAEKFNFQGFDSYDTVLTIHRKDKFRIFAEKHQYQVPKAVHCIEQAKMLCFPILIKPVDSFSGKGINKATNQEELRAFWTEAQKYSKTGSVIAEEFIDGQLYSHSAFIKNKKIVVDFFVNEYCTVYPYQVNSSNIAMLLPEQIQQGLREWTEQFAQDLNLCDGLIHTQFISDNKRFYLIEIARRCPGDLYSQLIQKSTGVNYSELYMMPFCGLKLPKKIEKKAQKYISRHTVSADKECVFISSNVDLECKNIQNIQLKYSGEKMKAAPFDKSGIYFIEYNSAEEMARLTENLKDHIKIETLDILCH